MQQTTHSPQREKSLAWQIQSYADLSGMSVDQLTERLAAYEAEIVKLRGALSAASSDAEWTARGKRALDRLNIVSRWIVRAISVRKEEEKRARHSQAMAIAAKAASEKTERTRLSAESRNGDLSAFVNAARSILPMDVYLSIWDAVNGKQPS